MQDFSFPPNKKPLGPFDLRGFPRAGSVELLPFLQQILYQSMKKIKDAPSLALRGFFFAILSIMTKKKSFFSQTVNSMRLRFFFSAAKQKKPPSLVLRGFFIPSL